MTKRIFLGALIGGIIVMIVGSVLHAVPPREAIGVKTIPQEDTVLSAMRTAIHEPGFYIFPALNMARGRSKEEVQSDTATYMEKYRQGPTGILVYDLGGQRLNFGKLLGAEFLVDFVSAFLVACILALGAGGMMSYWRRVSAVALIGLFAGVFLGFEYWNWSNFPTYYTLAYVVIVFLDWFFAGLAMAAIVKQRATS